MYFSLVYMKQDSVKLVYNDHGCNKFQDHNKKILMFLVPIFQFTAINGQISFVISSKFDCLMS